MHHAERPALEAELRTLYERFNSRAVDAALAMLDDDVAWANGMSGGHVHGREGVRDYWRRQLEVLDATVTPTDFEQLGPDTIRVAVRQVVRDHAGHPLSEQDLRHVFTFRGRRIVRFDIVST